MVKFLESVICLLMLTWVYSQLQLNLIQEIVVDVVDVRAPVFRVLLHFVYADALPPEADGANLDVALAQHLLVAADRFQLSRLRRICEQRLCETVEVRFYLF